MFLLWKSFKLYCHSLMGMLLRLCLDTGKMWGKEMDGGISLLGFVFGESVCSKTLFGCRDKCGKRN